MISAYVLMQLATTDPREALKAIRAVDGVKQAHLVAGPTDCIGYVEASDQEALSRVLLAVRGTKEVAATDTRIVLA